MHAILLLGQYRDRPPFKGLLLQHVCTIFYKRGGTQFLIDLKMLTFKSKNTCNIYKLVLALVNISENVITIVKSNAVKIILVNGDSNVLCVLSQVNRSADCYWTCNYVLSYVVMCA